MAENQKMTRGSVPRGVRMPGVQIKKGTFGRLLKFVFSNYKGRYLIVLICLLIASLSSVAMSVFMRKLIDECITPGLTEGWEAVLPNVIRVLTVLGVIYIIGVISNFIQTRTMATVTQGSLKKLRDSMFDNMQTLPIKYFDTHAHGDIMSTYTNDTDATRQMIGQTIPSIFTSTISIVSLVAVMLSYSVWMFLLVVLAIFMVLKVTGYFGGRSGKFMVAQQQSLAKEEGFIEEMMSGLKVVKVFTHEEEAKKDFDVLNDKLFNDSTEANKNGNVLGPLSNNIGNISYVILAVFGGVLYALNAPNLALRGIADGTMFAPLTLGVIVTFLGMFNQMSQMVGQMTMQVTMITMGLAGAGRCFDIIDEKSESDQGYCELVNVRRNADGSLTETTDHTNLWAWKHPHAADGTVTYQELKGEIELEHVDFGYVPEKLVLKDITLDAKAGQKFAFVGATGAGKTTITNLINRFYDIPDGKIRFDGININKIKKPDLRRSLGLVLQEVNLFTGTVMDNIRYGRLDATDEECIEAAKLANAHDFITRLPEGYNTMLTGNGASLSQGQRQLLSIARAAVANTPAMILDEATSSIDTRTEALVQGGMDKLMDGRTVFVIAHRLSTVRNSDAIIVLDHGNIIERGTHDELIEQKGTYYQLYTGAFELE